MNNYYLTLVLKPEMDEKERKALLTAMIKKITGSDGKVKKEDPWGVRDLSYKIKKETKGFFAHFELEANPASVKGIDKTLRVEEDILRHLLVRV